MATNTTNHGFKKPDESDFYSVQDQNRNWDTADGAFHSLEYPEFEDYTTGTPLPDAEAALAEMKSGKKHTNILSSIKSVLTGAFLKIYILKTMEEVMANTMEGRVADALLVKNINSNLNSKANSSDVTELNNKITSCYKNAVLLCQEKSGAITLSDSIYNYKILRFENNNFGFTTFPISDGGSNIIRVSTISMSGSIMVLCCGAWNVTNNGKTLTPSYMVQVNIDSSKTVTLFNTSASLTWNIVGYNQ